MPDNTKYEITKNEKLCVYLLSRFMYFSLIRDVRFEKITNKNEQKKLITPYVLN